MGDVQVFKDAACTEYLTTGEYDTVYVRLNRDFGYNQMRYWNEGETDNKRLSVFTPTDDLPTDAYELSAYLDFMYSNENVPLNEGVYILTSDFGLIYITNPHVIFYADGSSSVAP